MDHAASVVAKTNDHHHHPHAPEPSPRRVLVPAAIACSPPVGSDKVAGASHTNQRLLLPRLPAFLTVVLAAVWAGAGGGSSRGPRRPRGMAAAWTAMVLLSSLAGERVLVGATPKGLLTQKEFFEATWDVVNNLDAAKAERKWGVLAAWDVSGVADFSGAFSTQRNEAGPYVCWGRIGLLDHNRRHRPRVHLSRCGFDECRVRIMGHG